MRIIFAGGGTAGHVNPALAVAQYIKDHEKDTHILYVGAKGGMEETLVKNAGFDFKGINISGFSRDISLSGIKKNVVTLKRVITSSAESKKIIKEFNPDICMGTGGYVSGPVLRVAAKMGIPIVIHEQNAYPGVTTKMLAKYAKKIMIAVEDAREHINTKAEIICTGNPVRQEILTAKKNESRFKLGFDDRPVILSFGGSLGARKINEAVCELIKWSTKNADYQHIHAYGKYGKWFPVKLGEMGINIKSHKNLHIREYINNMPTCLASADIVICRAGAISLSELQVQGKPAILIPSPNVAENHQYHNAMALVNRNAAKIIEEKDLTGEVLIKTVNELLNDPEYLDQCRLNLQKMAILNASERIYSIIKQAVKN